MARISACGVYVDRTLWRWWRVRVLNEPPVGKGRFVTVHNSNPTARAQLRRRIVLTGVNALILVGALLAIAPSPPAYATNWYGATNYAATCPFDGNMTDNKSVVFSYIDASADLTNATNWVRAELMDPTQLATSTSRTRQVRPM